MRERYFTNAITEAVLARNSHVEHYRFQQESPKAHHISGWHVHQGRDSGFRIPWTWAGCCAQ